jgi:four helix bundle protein
VGAKGAMVPSASGRRICDAESTEGTEHSEIRRFVDGRPIALAVGMAGFKRFQDIIAWQTSHALKLRVDEFVTRPGFKHQYKLVAQITDASRSAPRNIAEGHMRGFKHKEFAQFVRVARGSLGEMLNHLLDAYELKLITEGELIACESLAKRAIKASTGLIQYLESTPDPPPPKYKRKKTADDDDPERGT